MTRHYLSTRRSVIHVQAFHALCSFIRRATFRRAGYIHCVNGSQFDCRYNCSYYAITYINRVKQPFRAVLIAAWSGQSGFSSYRIPTNQSMHFGQYNCTSRSSRVDQYSQ